MNTTEIKIRDFLVSHNIYPYSVLYIKDHGILKISFYLQTDIPEFLEITGYSKVCDNFGYKEYQDNTILVFGPFLFKILNDTENN